MGDQALNLIATVQKVLIRNSKMLQTIYCRYKSIDTLFKNDTDLECVTENPGFQVNSKFPRPKDMGSGSRIDFPTASDTVWL